LLSEQLTDQQGRFYGPVDYVMYNIKTNKLSVWQYYQVLILLLLGFAPSISMAINDQVRLANLPGTSTQQLRELADESDWQVRQAVAMNRKTPSDVLEKLARDPVQDVRIAVCTNLSTTEPVFFILAKDPSEQVRSVVARFEYVSAAVLASMSNDSSTDIRIEVARNWNTDIPTLEKLSKDEFEEVRNMALHSINDRKKQEQ